MPFKDCTDSDTRVNQHLKVPKCNANHECLVCDSDSTDQQFVRERASNSRRQNVTLKMSANCSFLIESDDVVLDEDFVLSARTMASFQGPGSVRSITMTAPIVEVGNNIKVSKAVKISRATKVVAKDLSFDDTYGGVIIQNTQNGLDAEIDDITNQKGPCVGVVNSRGVVRLSKCDCGRTKHAMVIQQPFKDPDLKQYVVGSGKCTVFDSSSEFAMFGREYEVRFNNEGQYEYHPLVIEQLVPIMLAGLVVLVVLLPCCHGAMWNMLMITVSKHHKH